MFKYSAIIKGRVDKIKKIKTKIDGLFIIEPQIFEDDRGHFFESYNYNTFKEMEIDNIFVQDNHSKSLKGVLRGLHFQKGEYSQAKLISILKGSILDIVVDLRKNSETFGKYFSVELSERNKKMLFIPKNFAHGFLTLEDNTEIFYKCDNFYNPKSEMGIIWNDYDLNIDWNFEKYNIDENKLIISEKDKKNISFKEYKKINNIE